MCVVAVMARLGEVRLDMAVEVGSVEVRQRKARCGKAVRVRLGEVRLAWLGVAGRGEAVSVSHGSAGSGWAWRSRLGAYRSGSVRFGMAV
jgi:hypothetical protein